MPPVTADGCPGDVPLLRLRSILEQSLIDTMYELPSVSNVEKVVVDESTIEENQPPLLVYHEAAKKA